jgi:V/A-type H+/Na+-transporting ATPase subunit C
MAAGLDLVNARLGARRGRLLGGDGLRFLAGDGTLEARLARLRQGGWAAAVPPKGVPALAEVEALLRDTLRREARWILELAQGHRPRAVLGAFLELAEADAVKALLRGVAAGAAPERTMAAAPVSPGLPEPLLRSVAAAASVEAAVARLGEAHHPLAGPIRDALPARARWGLPPVEAAADRAAAGRAPEAAATAGQDGRILADYLADRADAHHAGLLLSLAGAGPRDAARMAALTLPGGRRLAPAEVARLAGAAPEVVQAALKAAFPAAAGLSTPWGADLELERRLSARARRAARANPLSVAVPIAYLLDRRAEARRIAVLLRAAALELPADEVLPLLEV